ncbi:MAG: DegT/DnrJ/EryC1/StrS family aminotransferase [Bacteroidota bacterium]
MHVPFVDLRAQYHSLKKEIDNAIFSVIEDSEFIKGKYVAAFEKEFALAYGVRHCIGVANGTDAIYIVLKMLGIGEGDEVITVANSWISSSETITQAGARAVFVDTEPDFYSIDTTKIEEKITPKTRAIIPVHLYGQPAEVDKIKAICEKHKLVMIEDCSQSHFAQINGQTVGSFGLASTFSFYPGKNLGAYGDAGAVITNDDELARKVRMYSNHGALVKHQHEMEGINSRLDGMHAAILSAKLPYIKKWNEMRFKNALYMNDSLAGIKGIETPKIRKNSSHIFHLYVVKADQRNELQKYLKENGIETAVHYPTPLPLLPAYKYLGLTASDFPVTSLNQEKILSLPMYPELSKEQMDYIVHCVKKFYL